MSAPPATPPLVASPAPVSSPSAAVLRHSWLDDVAGILVGAFLASLGLFLLKTTGAVTGGTAGIALLLSYASPVPFGVLFFAVNAPFFALAWWKKGAGFTVRSALTVALVSALASLHPLALTNLHLDQVYGVLVGNLLAGVGMLILFRHRSSLGGTSILALIVHERTGWRAGYVQMSLDVVIISSSLLVVAPLNVALSAMGAVVLSLIIAMNHRPGRYVGA